MANLYDYLDAGFRVFGIYGAKKGKCECGDPECKAVLKHPIMSNWQHTPDWSDEQIETFELMGHFKTGFGVLCSGYLIIDVDARNGGVESFAKLIEKYPSANTAAFVVNTGSGGGSQHHYFRLHPPVAMVQSHQDYPGIDFKTTGYVIGASSMHASGMCYETERGTPHDVTDAPESLIELLRKPERTRTIIGEQFVDVSTQEIVAMLEYYPNNSLHYDEWLYTGMALHHALGGSAEAFSIWERWSETSDKHNAAGMDKKWHSFGKCAQPVTLGTIYYHACQNGYVAPVTFELDSDIESLVIEHDLKPAELPFDAGHIDLLRPPGFVGKVTDWINKSSFYKRERLATASALVAIGNLGMHYRDDITGVTPNLMMLCVAGSGTGKEAIQERFADLMRAGDMQSAVHGDIKSKQEIVRNLIEHQLAAYCTDEIGEVLKSIENAKKRGGAAYLEGVTGEIMKIYTKASGTMLVSGDLRRDLMEALRKNAAQLLKTVEKQDPGYTIAERKLEKLEEFMALIESGGGIPQPFLSMIGFTTSESIEPALSVELAKNGFLNRAFIIQEHDTNPRPNKGYSPEELPYTNDILRICATGKTRQPGERIEVYGMEKMIRTEPPAKALLELLFDWQWHFAEYHKATTSYEALARRAYEFIGKISLCLAIGDNGVRTIEHVRWAAAFVYHDIKEKIRLVRHVESRESTDSKTVEDGLRDRIQSFAADGIYRSQLWHKLKRKDIRKSDFDGLVDTMVKEGLLSIEGRKVTSVYQ